MAEIKNVLLIGASGNIGSHILTGLLSSPFTVTVLTRPDSTSDFPEAVKVVRSDYTLEALTPLFKGQDAVVSAVGHVGFESQFTFIDAAVAAGVKRFIPSEFGSDTTNKGLQQLLAPANGATAKLEAVEYLKSKEKDGLSWTSVISGPFLDLCLNFGFFEIFPSTRKATLWNGGRQRFIVTSRPTIGIAVARILQQPELTKNIYVFIKSFTTSQQELISVAEKVSGEKYVIEEVNGEAKIKEAEASLTEGAGFAAAYPLIKAGFLVKSYGDYEAEGRELWNEKLGLPNEDLEESVAQALGI
ncbi:isoflavone reductase family protein [Patellaria atrata CBS 101060]|uniref:Isoflavone reductase family protein n=1 Tax=Patellaria atrata CBS 101060 TaxID=1346257 RepID=A0A9P4SDW6_9PEZI|nr:isoflavone reductase family protein [Patellaria atrata CBS 101060]